MAWYLCHLAPIFSQSYCIISYHKKKDDYVLLRYLGAEKERVHSHRHNFWLWHLFQLLYLWWVNISGPNLRVAFSIIVDTIMNTIPEIWCLLQCLHPLRNIHHVYVCLFAYVHLCRGNCLSQSITLYLVPLRKVHHWPWSQVVTQQHLCAPATVLELQACATLPSLFVFTSVGDLNSGPQAHSLACWTIFPSWLLSFETWVYRCALVTPTPSLLWTQFLCMGFLSKWVLLLILVF